MDNTIKREISLEVFAKSATFIFCNRFIATSGFEVNIDGTFEVNINGCGEK